MASVVALPATACQASDATAIQAEITALYPNSPSLRGAALSQFSSVKTQCTKNPADAQSKAVRLAGFAAKKFLAHQLLPTATAADVSSHINHLFLYVGLPQPGDLSEALSGSGGAAVVGPSDPPTNVVTGDRKAGVSIPTGAISTTQTVLVTVTLSADQTDPLPTTLPQYGPFYDFHTFPLVTKFAQQVTIGICATVPQAVAGHVQLARPDAANPTAIEILARGPAVAFLGCSPLPVASRGVEQPGLLGRLFAAATRWLRPRELHAGALQVDLTGGITAKADNYGNSTGTFDPLSHLEFTAQPGTTVAGQLITPSVQVTVQTGGTSPQTITTYSGNVTLAIGTNPSGGTLMGAPRVCNIVTGASLCAGVATFDISIDQPGNGYTLVATASGTDPTPKPATSDPFNIVAGAALTLVKSATPTTYSAVGAVISYSYVLTNSGNVSLTGPFTITDDKATGEACPATPSSLAPLASITCTASYTVTQADLDAGSVTNTATGHGFSGTSVVNSNTDSKTVTATQVPALTLVKGARPSTYSAVGTVIAYSYTIRNTGNVTLTGTFSITDDQATVGCPQPADGALSPNETMICAATYAITQTDLDAGRVTNKATASGAGVTSNEATATVTAVLSPMLTLVKSATPTTYSAVGAVISYSYLLTNSGNVTLSAPFTITDDRATNAACPATPTTLAPGASITCTGSYTITQPDLDAGSVTNTATGHAKLGTSVVNSNPDTKTVTAIQTARLVFTQQPVNTPRSTPIPPVRVEAWDASNNIITSFNGNVTVTIGNNPSGGTLSGTTTIAAVAGVVTFSSLSIDLPGAGYTLTATTIGLAGAVSLPFNITP